MAILSPGIEIIEVDASAIVPTESISVGQFAGQFSQGPLEQSIFVSNTETLTQVFGKPDDGNRNQWYQAYNFLQYGNMLLVGRAKGSGDANANAFVKFDKNASTTEIGTEPGVLIKNHQEFENKIDDGSAVPWKNSGLLFQARSAGKWGNDIEVAIAKSDDFENDSSAFDIKLKNLFEYEPDENELAIAVKHEEQIETYIVSLDKKAIDSNNRPNFIETVINRESNLVYVTYEIDSLDDDGEIVDFDSAIDAGVLKLENGQTGTVDNAQISETYEKLWGNKDAVEVDIIIGNEKDNGKGAVDLANKRKDCIAFIGQERDKVIGSSNPQSDIVTWSQGNTFSTSSYIVLVGNYKYQYDKHSDKNIWVNLAGDIAGLRAQTNTSHAAWWASAGLERGQVKNVLKLGFVPDVGERDMLYKNGINPVTTFPGLGTVMWGQKTFQKKPSSFDRVNVRSLFNVLERSLSNMSKFQIFEFNDEFTRNRINAMVRPFLETVQAGRGIQDFIFICDETNNTPDVISRNELVIDIFIKPTYVQEFIKLRFTNVGVNDFSTVISS